MPEPRIHVDFNDIQEDGRISALKRHADIPEAVEPGALVALWDEDGDTAQGRVESVGERDLVEIEVLMDSWIPGEPHETEPVAVPFIVADSIFVGAGKVELSLPSSAPRWHIRSEVDARAILAATGGTVVAVYVVKKPHEQAGREEEGRYFIPRSVTIGTGTSGR